MGNQQQTSIDQGRVVLYVRTNRSGNLPNGRSVEDQLEQLRKFCIDEGKSIVGTYIDEGISRIDIKSLPSLNRLLEDAKQGEFNEMLTIDLSKISRNTVDILNISYFLESHHVALKTINNRLDSTTASGKFMMHMLTIVGEYELNIAKEKTQSEQPTP